MALIFHDWFGVSTDARRARSSLMLDHIDLYRATVPGLVPRPAARGHARPGDAALPQRRQQRQEQPERELRPRGHGAVHARRRPRRVHRGRRAAGGPRADGLARRLREQRRLDELPLRPVVARLRPKTIFGHVGNFDWRDVVDLCLQQPLPPLVLRAEAVVATSSRVRPDAATQAALEKIYVDSDWSIRAVLEAILRHPALHTGGRRSSSRRSCSAPACCARARAAVTTMSLLWWADGAGQRLFYPPNVSGWNDNAWLDTSTLYARWRLVYDVDRGRRAAEQHLQLDRDPGRGGHGRAGLLGRPAAARRQPPGAAERRDGGRAREPPPAAARATSAGSARPPCGT